MRRITSLNFYYYLIDKDREHEKDNAPKACATTS